MIQIKNIGKHSGKATQSKVSSGGFASSVTNIVANETQGVNIWGQYHDHTGDVDGDASEVLLPHGQQRLVQIALPQTGLKQLPAKRITFW